MQSKYEEDFCEWAALNAIALQEKRFNDVDCKNLIEELRLMGASERRALISSLTQLLLHLLKWQFQPNYRGVSWKVSIIKQRRLTSRILRDNPSLKSKISHYLKEALDDARLSASLETGLNIKTFSTECPYTFEQIMCDEFYPEELCE